MCCLWKQCSPRLRIGGVISFLILLFARITSSQTAPVSPNHSWHGPEERRIQAEAKTFYEAELELDPGKTCTLPELIDLAESHNPETRVAWERARAQAAAWGVAHSELYPTVAAAALAGVDRDQAYLVDRFSRHTIGDFEVVLNLNYTIFDFGARAGRINTAKAEALAANFAFNDTHRNVIYRVEQAYYQLLNTAGQEEAARANLSNAQAVQQAAEERLNNGLATLPDVLEARSATAQAKYELQAVLGAEEIAHGNLANALGTIPQTAIHVQPLRELTIPSHHRRHRQLCDGSRTGATPGPPSAGRRRPHSESEGQGSARGLLSLAEFHRQSSGAVAIRVTTAASLGTNSRPGGRHGL